MLPLLLPVPAEFGDEKLGYLLQCPYSHHCNRNRIRISTAVLLWKKKDHVRGGGTQAFFFHRNTVVGLVTRSVMVTRGVVRSCRCRCHCGSAVVLPYSVILLCCVRTREFSA